MTTTTPAFLDSARPEVPDIVVPRGVHALHLPRRPVRGRLIRLGPLARRAADPPRQPPRGDTPRRPGPGAGGRRWPRALKFRGSFSIQAKGDGPVPMLLADCTEAGALRGYARADAERLAALLDADPRPAAALLGGGYLAFTVDQGGDIDRHQGIVAIEGESLAEMALHYFGPASSSACIVRLACAMTAGGWRAGALILEKVAGEGGIDPALDAEAQDEGWRTALALAATLTDAELLDDALPARATAAPAVPPRGRAARSARALSYGCRCSRARLSGILEGFPERRPRPHGGGRRHHHDLRVLQPRFPLRPDRGARQGRGRLAA